MADQEVPPGSLFPPGDNTRLIPINIEDEMKRSYLDYAMSVIVGRALPDVRDGPRGESVGSSPVQRRRRAFIPGGPAEPNLEC